MVYDLGLVIFVNCLKAKSGATRPKTLSRLLWPGRISSLPASIPAMAFSASTVDGHRLLALGLRLELGPEQRRLDAWRGQFDHGHARALKLSAQGLAEGVHRGFRGGINRSGEHRHERQPGGDVDDERARPGLEMRQELLHHADGSAQVDLDLARHVGEIAVFVEVQVAHDPGVVDQGIQSRKPGQDLCVQSRDGGGIAHVAAKDMDAGERPLGRVEFFLVAAGDDDCVAAGKSCRANSRPMPLVPPVIRMVRWESFMGRVVRVPLPRTQCVQRKQCCQWKH